MATLTFKLDLEEEFTSRGRTRTLGEMLEALTAWEEGDELDPEEFEPSDANVARFVAGFYWRRLALADDQQRYGKGRLAAHAYSPRVDKVENAPAPVVALRKAAEKVEASGVLPQVKGHKKAPKKAPAASPAVKKIPEGVSGKRRQRKASEQVRATPPVGPVITVKAPTVRKVQAAPVKVAPAAEPAPVPLTDAQQHRQVEHAAQGKPTEEVFTVKDGKLVPVAQA